MTSGSLEHRWSTHIRDARNAVRTTALQSAINKYGAESFVVESLEESDDRELLCEREVYWIEQIGTLAPNGYNLKSGGESGYQFTLAARRKISAGVLRSRLDPAVCQRHTDANAQASRTTEAREKRSALSRKFWADESRREHQRTVMKAHWADGKRAKEHGSRMRKAWQDAQYRERVEAGLREAAPCVSIDGVIYRSQADAAEHLCLPKHKVNYRVRSNLSKWKGWFNVD